MGNEVTGGRPDLAGGGADGRPGGWPDPGQVSVADLNVKQRVRLVPLLLAIVAVLCSVVGPNAGVYLTGHSVALVVALAVPASYWWLSRDAGASNKTMRPAMTVALSVFAALLAFAEAVMLSYGSAEGAVADIGGTFLWMVGGLALLALSGTAAFLWPRKDS